MSSSSDLKVQITGDASGLFKTLGDSSAAVKGMAKEMEGAVGGLKNLLMGFAAPLAALAAVVGGKEFLKGTVEETKNWTVEAQKLSRVLNITTEAASVLNLAIGDIYGTQEEYLGAVAKLTKTLNGNEEAIQRLGVATREANGQYRDTPTIMAEVNAALAKIEGGTARNVASAQIYGKSWMEVQRYLKLTPEVMQAAQEKAEKLNLIVGQDSVEATNAYRASMNDLDDTMKGLKIRLGNELMPLLTEWNNDLAENGPGAVSALGVAFKWLYVLIMYSREAWEKVLNGLTAWWDILIERSRIGWHQLKALARGEMQTVLALEANFAAFNLNRLQESSDDMEEIAARYAAKIERLMGGGPKKDPKDDDGGGDGPVTPKETPDPYDAFEAQTKAEAKARRERLALWDKHQADMYEIFGDALDVQIKKLNDHYDELLNRERDFGADEEVLQRIEVERTVAIEKAKTDAAAKASEERRRRGEEDAKERRRILEEIGSAEEGFLDGMDQYLKKQGTTFQQWSQGVQQMLQGVTSAFAAGIQGILSGQMSLSQGMKTIWKGIVQAVIQAIAQLIAKWIVMTAVKKALGIEEAATDGGRTAGALTTAAAQTWAAYSGIPFYGPALALAQIALMYTSMGASVAASEGVGVSVAATARKVGGRVDRPEFTLLGEAGPEIVAPESDFRDYTRTILSLGANLGANISAADARVMGYGRAASSYATAAPQYGSQPTVIQHITQIQGHFIDSSERGRRMLGEISTDASRSFANERGVVLKAGQVLGGL